MSLHVEYEEEEDGRWIAEIPELPGVMCMARRVRMQRPRRICDDFHRFVSKLPSAGRGGFQKNQVIRPDWSSAHETE